MSIDRIKKGEIHETVSQIFKATVGNVDPTELSDERQRQIESLYPPGSPECSIAMRFKRQFEKRDALPAAEPHKASHFESWWIVRNDETLGDRIRFIEKIGKGATSDVYLAASKYGDRCIAVKLVSDTHFSGKVRVALVVRELQNLFRVTHRNVVQIYDAGTIRSDDGREAPFVLMEYIEGETLTKWRQDSAAVLLSPDRREAVKTVSTIASALHFLHTLRDANDNPKPVFHLDVKPSNIMRTHDGPKLIDFGSLAQEPSLGQLGTREYLAPGRLDPEVSPNASWDIFALGGVLYFLLTGEHPLPAHPDPRDRNSHLTKSEWDEWLGSIDLADSDLTLVCRKCLAYHPSDRYESANQVEEDLTACLTNHPLPHAREGDYTWWETEMKLWERGRKANNVDDHTQIIGRTALILAVLAAAMGIGHAVLVATGFPPEEADFWTTTVVNVLIVVLLSSVMYAIRFQISSVKIIEPMIAVILSFVFVQYFAVPEHYFSIPNWPERITCGLIAVSIVGIVNISFASLSPEWKMVRYFGWFTFASAFFLRPLFESRFSSFAMPVVLSAFEVILCLIYASVLIRGRSSQGDSR